MLSKYKDERDEKGELTDLALAVNAIQSVGCDCGTDEPGTCLACLCEPVLERLLGELEEFRQLRESVRWFAGEMEKKLKAHDDRPGWKKDHFEVLFHRLVEEANELAECLHPVNTLGTTRLIKEAADVANFAMMLADNAKTLSEKPGFRLLR